jgi:hypothetical protein
MFAALLLGAMTLAPKDILFAQVQESWVKDATVVYNLDQVLPVRQAYLIRRLGDGHRDCRDVAEAQLQLLGDDALRASAWGMMMRDPEVSMRSRRLYNRFLRCPRCEGDGMCHACNGQSNIQKPCPRNCGVEFYCTYCKGSKSVRYTKNFLGDFVEIDYFEPRKGSR